MPPSPLPSSPHLSMTIHPCTYAADRPTATAAAAARCLDGLCVEVEVASAAVEAEVADEGHGENVNSWSCGRGRGATGEGPRCARRRRRSQAQINFIRLTRARGFTPLLYLTFPTLGSMLGHSYAHAQLKQPVVSPGPLLLLFRYSLLSESFTSKVFMIHSVG